MTTRAVRSYEVGATAPNVAVRPSLTTPDRNLYDRIAQPKISP